MPVSIAVGSTLSSRHYSLAKLVKAARNLVKFSFPDQLSCDNHLFFDGLHPLSTSTKGFYNNVLSSKEDISEGFRITRESFTKVLLVLMLLPNSRECPFLRLRPSYLRKWRQWRKKQKIWVRISWFDNVIGKMLKAKDHQKIAEKIDSIREHMESL